MRLNYQNLSSILKNYKVSQNSFISKEFIIPLEQEYATDYKNIVQKDDIVKEGQIIAISTGNSKSKRTSDESTFIHSPVPGKVMDILPVYTSSGKQKFAVKIKFGGEFSYLGKKNTEKLQLLHVNTDGLLVKRKNTTTKTRVLGGHQQMLRIDFEENEAVYGTVEDEIIKYIKAISNLKFNY